MQCLNQIIFVNVAAERLTQVDEKFIARLKNYATVDGINLREKLHVDDVPGVIAQMYRPDVHHVKRHAAGRHTPIFQFFGVLQQIFTNVVPVVPIVGDLFQIVGLFISLQQIAQFDVASAFRFGVEKYANR